MVFILRLLTRIDAFTLNGKLRRMYFSMAQNSSLRGLKKSAVFQYAVYSDQNSSPLTLLSEKYGSDKGSASIQNPYPWPPHTYANYYHVLFGRQRNTINKVFECGIGSADESIKSNMSVTGATGASLRMWREYFPNASILGGDIDPKAIFQEDRISTFLLDQTDPKSIQDFWKNVGDGEFDIMIDDGLHSFEAGKTLFENSFYKLSSDGIYVIEDVNIFDVTRYKKYFGSLNFNVNYITLYFGKNITSDDCLITITH